MGVHAYRYKVLGSLGLGRRGDILNETLLDEQFLELATLVHCLSVFHDDRKRR
jgi:hypothetical protein